MALMSEAARFKAQVNFAEKITFPAVLNEYPDLKHSQTKLFNKIMSSYKKEKAALEQNVELSKQELEIVLPLVKDGLMSQLERIRLEKQLSEAKSNLSIMLGEFKTAAEADLTEKQNTIISLQEKLKGLEDQMTRTEIIAPVAGYIHNFKFNTVGGVIKSGVDVLEIVPIEEQVVIEAKINPRDRAFIRKEQSAVVKFPAYDSSIYGGLDARVISISPDTEKDEKNNEFYLVRLVTEKNYVNDDKLLTIIPGMTADVNILTGKKRILYYLLKPVTRFKENALRER
jgi:adhesin transport system membrane fusion protein